ncbi:MAG TPA: glycosyltransferase family 1 protein [Aggregatilineales bacterium]|nr:glycosyltransferase family 1 protein [Aggregatilineales bacterium]
MRIGIDARLHGYRSGGIAEYTRQLLKALAALDSSNEYVVMQSRRDRESLTFGENFRRLNAFTPPHHRMERIALAAEAARWRLDVLHSPDFIPPRFGAQRKIITVHDLNFLMYPQFQTPDSLRYYAGHITAAAREADVILTVSEATRRDVADRLKVPINRLIVQYEGVDPAFHPLPPETVAKTRTRLSLPSTYLLFVGTLEPRKNIPRLLADYARLREIVPDAPPLVLVGRRGWLFDPIFACATELRLEAYLNWMENVTFVDLPAVYNGASALIMPSFYEGFGLPPLEAMACGVPVIVSDRGALPEIVGSAGAIVDLDQPDALVAAMHRALTDITWRVSSIAKGYARVARFTWKHTAEVALSAYSAG